MNRDKDKQLARAGHLFEARAMDALAWFNRNPQAAGTKTAKLTRRLRKLSLKAGKLARAASRPMSVAVFGASQAGKSFMTGQMISPAHRPTQVVFETAGELTRLDYGTRINPTGGKETTGLVTRFSIQPHEHPAPAGHPVVLKMLREVDVLKILANTHVFDCKAQWENNRSLDEGLVDALFERVGASLGTGETPGMSISQIYELREYLETDLEDHPLARARDDSRAPAEAIALCEHYWRGIERLAPHANAQERCALFAPLWGELPEFSALYLNLKDALDRLNHPEWGYVPLEGVLDRSYGVLHAETLYSMDPAHADTLQGPARNTTRMIAIIGGDSGTPVSLPQPVVTALTLELRLTLEHAPWDFFAHTDFLDFPGAKSRENKNIEDFLRDPTEKKARAHCFLRGKVAVLFDNYTADLEANALVLMEDDAQSEVKTLPRLVERWVAKTHGETPEQRTQQPVSLFFVVSKSDTLFTIAGNQEGYGDSIRNRLTNNITPYGSWTYAWTPGKAFDNVFFFRNPSVEQAKLVDYESIPVSGKPVPPETGLKNTFVAELPAFKRDYLASPLVKAHVKDAETRLERMLALNDGGVTLLAESLKPVCDPDLKYSQIVPPMQQVRTELETLIAPYFEGGDVERRVAARLNAIAPFCTGMEAEPKQVGPFVRMLQTNDSTMKRCSEIFEKAHAARRTAYLAAEGAADDGLASSFGAQVLADWRKHVLAIAGDATLARGFRVTPDALACAVREVIGAADRAGVDTRIDAIVSEIKATPRNLHQGMAFRIGMCSARILNDVVSELSDQAPPAPSAEPPPPWPDLPADAHEIAVRRSVRSLRWVEALRQATELNARGGKGSVVTAEDNALLGAIIAAISAEVVE